MMGSAGESQSNHSLTLELGEADGVPDYSMYKMLPYSPLEDPCMHAYIHSFINSFIHVVLCPLSIFNSIKAASLYL